MKISEEIKMLKQCPSSYALAINDVMNIISGKWKLAILGSIHFDKKRFTEIQTNIKKITPRMLSKELKELELNGVIKRIVKDTTPVSVEYQLTRSGESISSVLDVMIEWGLQHRIEALKRDRIKED